MGNEIKSFWNERWIILKEFPTKQKNYYFSDYGRIKSVDKLTEVENLLKGSIIFRGYRQINITYKDNIKRGYYIHKLVAEAFCTKDHEEQKFVIHLDRDLSNNHYENLKWMSQREMTDFQIEKGIYNPENRKRGYLTKMNPTRVRLLKKRLKEGKTKKKILAKSFNITVEQLRKIEKGIDWGYVKLEDEDSTTS